MDINQYLNVNKINLTKLDVISNPVEIERFVNYIYEIIKKTKTKTRIDNQYIKTYIKSSFSYLGNSQGNQAQSPPAAAVAAQEP